MQSKPVLSTGDGKVMEGIKMNLDFTKWLEWAGRATATSLLAAILMTGYLGVWIWGSELTQMRLERDEWKTVAMKAAHIAEGAHPNVVGMAPPTGSSDIGTVKARLQLLEGN